MSLGSSDMAGSVLGTAFLLLLLASIIQGQNVDVFYKEKIEAIVGQDVELPCIVENRPDLYIVGIEWSKEKNNGQKTKLALYDPRHPPHLFLSNVTIQIANNSKGSYLNLFGVTEWDSGIYVCDLATFPLGFIKRETELKIKDAVLCDVNGTVEVNAGENVTIQCSEFSDAQYWWTKNEEMVSDNKPLELLRVTDADTGVYKLTVNASNKYLHKEFNVTVLTATTTTRTGLATVSPQSNITEDGLTESAGSSLTTSPTTVLTTTDTNVTWTINMSSDGTSSDATDDNSNISNVTLTSYTNNTQISLTSTPATHTDLYYSNNTTDQDLNATHTSETSTFSDQSVTSNLSTALSYGSTDSVIESTQETWTNTSTLPTMQPEIDPSTSQEDSETQGNVTENSANSNTGATTTLRNVVVVQDEVTAQSELLLVLIIVPVLVLIAVAAYIYRKQVIKQRMDLPPPFKPPPPPVKYTAARHCEISTQLFPTSRCNSVTQGRELRLYEYTA